MLVADRSNVISPTSRVGINTLTNHKIAKPIRSPKIIGISKNPDTIENLKFGSLIVFN